MKQLFFPLLLLVSANIFAQPVEIDIFQKTATATTSQIGIRARATGIPVNYIGLTFYILYQSSNAGPQSTAQNSVTGVDDSKLVTTFGWGTTARFTNPQQTVNIDPGAPGGQIYNRRYIYGNIDENGGVNVETLTAAWDTLLYVSLNTLQPVYPQGGYAYQQATSEALGASLSDPGFANIPFIVNSGDRALGINILSVLFSQSGTHCIDKGTEISWNTSAEQTTGSFDIEKSMNTTEWKSIGTVMAAGNSSTEKNYSFTDTGSTNGYYRIKEINTNGNYSTSRIMHSACFATAYSMVLYPVPAKDILHITLEYTHETWIDLEIADIQGRIVFRSRNNIISGKNNIKLNIHTLPAGTYILSSSSPTIKFNKKFIVLK